MDDFDELQFKEFELKRRVGLKSISSHVVHGGRHGPKKPLGGYPKMRRLSKAEVLHGGKAPLAGSDAGPVGSYNHNVVSLHEPTHSWHLPRGAALPAHRRACAGGETVDEAS